MPFSCLAPLDGDALLRGRTLSLRRETPADSDFLRRMFHQIRAPRFAPAGWPEPVLGTFLDHQFLAQTRHYAQTYPQGEFLVLERGDQPAGRLSIDADAGRIHIIDIALDEPQRGQGLGTDLLNALIRLAAAGGRRITLQVEEDNLAQRLYHRLGFHIAAEQPPYRQMVWNPHPPA